MTEPPEEPEPPTLSRGAALPVPRFTGASGLGMGAEPASLAVPRLHVAGVCEMRSPGGAELPLNK